MLRHRGERALPLKNTFIHYGAASEKWDCARIAPEPSGLSDPGEGPHRFDIFDCCVSTGVRVSMPLRDPASEPVDPLIGQHSENLGVGRLGPHE